MTGSNASVYKEDYRLGTYEEDREIMMGESVKILGKPGKIIYPLVSTTCTNMVLTSPKYGRLWYGDIDSEEVDDILAKFNTLDDSANWSFAACN